MENNCLNPSSLTRRLLAFLIDLFILALFTNPIFISLFWVPPIIFVGYFAIMESSTWKATLGKRLFNIQVQHREGEAITFPEACVRNVCKLLSLPALFLFAIPMFFSKDKQGLHDLAVDSYVVRKQH